MVLLPAQGTDVAEIARVAFTSEDRVRDVIRNVDADGFSSWPDNRRMLRLGTIVLNVKDARRASQFWSQALGYACRDGDYSPDTTPVLLPQPASAVAVALEEDDRTHLDLHTDSALEQQAEVDRLVSLSATHADWAYPDSARFVVLADPEGNLFCVVNTGRQ
jgi:predicted enzyme related to lactoylglutathione lyase